MATSAARPDVIVALFRPHDDALTSAARLRQCGVEAVVAPASEIRPTGLAPPDDAFAALLATSAHALAALSPAACARLAATPLFVVGERTAAAAAARGFSRIEAVGADAAALAGLIDARVAPEARLLYLAGRDRKDALEAALAQSGVCLVVVELYAAQARAAWSAGEAAQVAGCTAALHYSRRGATLAAALAAQAGLAAPFRAMAHACLSRDVAEPLLALGADRVGWATTPQEGPLFQLVLEMSGLRALAAPTLPPAP